MKWDGVEQIVNPLIISPTKIISMSACGYRVYLEKTVPRSRTGAWWFVGGRAFAEFKQDFEAAAHRGDLSWPSEQWARKRFYYHFGLAIEEARESEGPIEAWSAANKGTEDGSWWAVHGPDMAALYVRRNPVDRPFETLTLPDGSLALEVGITAVLGNRLVSARMDHITLDRSGYVDIQDDKTGSRWPEDSFQLEIYAVLIEQWLNVSVARLHYYLARPLPKTSKVSRKEYLITKQWDPNRTAQVIDRVERAATHMEAGMFLPVVSNLCKACNVRSSCAFGGTSKEVL